MNSTLNQIWRYAQERTIRHCKRVWVWVRHNFIDALDSTVNPSGIRTLLKFILKAFIIQVRKVKATCRIILRYEYRLLCWIWELDFVCMAALKFWRKVWPIICTDAGLWVELPSNTYKCITHIIVFLFHWLVFHCP